MPSKKKTLKTKKVDRGLIGAAKSQFHTIKDKVSKSRKALENDPIKAISEAVLQNIKKMKMFAQPNSKTKSSVAKKSKIKKTTKVKSAKRKTR